MNWVFFAVSAAIFAAIAAILEKKTLLREHAMQFSAVLAISNMILGTFLLFKSQLNLININLLIIIFFASILGSLGFLFMAKAVRHMQISISAPLIAITPAITAIFGFIILKEKISLIQIIGILLIVFGTGILTYKKHKKIIYNFLNDLKSKYHFFILLSIIFYSLASVADRFILTTYNIDAITYVALIQIFIAIHFLIMIIIFYKGLKDIKEGFKKAKWLIIIISLSTIGYRIAQSEAFKLAQTGLVVAIKKMSVLIVVIMGGEIFKEKEILNKVLASIIMIFVIRLIIL